MSGRDDPGHAMAALQLLATRLLQRDIDPAVLPEGDTVQPLPEQLPADLPIELLLPPGARLIGSVVSWPLRETAIVLDAPLSPEAVYAFYGERLLATGWREWTSVKVASGFVDDTPYIWLKHHIHPKFFTPGAPPQHIFYRDGTAPWPPYRAEEVGDPNPGPVLFVHATAVPSKPTEVRLWLVEDAHGIAGMGLTDANPRLLAMLPVLTPPLGVRHRSTSGGSSAVPAPPSADRNTSLNLRGVEMTIDEVDAHYRAQLIAADWRLQDEERGGSLVRWSRWAVPGDDEGRLQGDLLVRTTPWYPQLYNLTLRIEDRMATR